MDFRQNNDGSFYKTYCIMKISFDENPWFVDWLGIDFLKNDLLMWICARPCPPLSAGSGAQCRDRSVCNSYMSMCTDVDIHICIYIYIYRERERCMYTHLCMYVYIYIYIYVCGERERERKIYRFAAFT